MEDLRFTTEASRDVLGFVLQEPALCDVCENNVIDVFFDGIHKLRRLNDGEEGLYPPIFLEKAKVLIMERNKAIATVDHDDADDCGQHRNLQATHCK
jgi:hypothetical protein